jgi:hypothetical protein
MLSIRCRLVFILTITGLLCLPGGSRAQDQQSAQEPTATAPAELAQVPPGQFAVTYVNGELAIKARNAPLGEILRAICSQIGAELEAQSEPREPILGILGPGPAKAVLASLLADEHIDYVIRSGAEDPNVIASLAIFPQTKDSNPRNQLAQDPAGQPQDSSATTASVSERSSVSQLMELVAAARTELASGAAFDTQGGKDSDGGVEPASGADTVDMAASLQLIEEQLKAAAAAEAAGGAGSNSTQSRQQADASTSDAAKPDPNALPLRRPRHRGHH